MKEYHKIQTVFKRDPENKNKTLLHGDYSLPEFEYLKDNKWVFTEKVDGTNIRVMLKEGELSFSGKTDDSQIPSKLVNTLSEMFRPIIESMKLVLNEEDVCFYGEGYGPKIQKVGKLYRPDQGFVLFDVRIGDFWLQRHDVEDIANKLLLDIVPIIGEGTLDDMCNMCETGFESMWGAFQAEGIVARPKTELKTRSGDRIITKLKFKDFTRL